ncbi:MAG: co-chaperone GroES [Bacilli bacterium]|jgi:chaperonin GroES|nr:co-chaperone GroES [Bacilli bacterium]
MIKPLRDYVVLEKLPEEKKVGSIIIASTHENDSAVATVVAVGPGYTDSEGHKITVQAAAGEKVIYKKYSTTDVDQNGKKYMLIQDKDILAVVD